MAMTLADVRAKYPAYKDVDDQALADALYKKYYSTADRREFDARIGLKPYDGVVEGLVKGAHNALPSAIQSLGGVEQAAGEFLNNAANGEAPAPRVSGLDPLSTIMDNAPTAIAGVVNLLPDDMKKGIALEGAKESLRGQLHARAAEQQIQAVDAPVLSPANIAATATTSTIQMVPALAASILLRNPTPALLAAGVQSGGQAYTQGRQDQYGDFSKFLEGAGKAGLSPQQAGDYAKFYAAAEAIPEMLPLGVLLKEGGSLVGRVVKGTVAEAVQEGITQAAQSALDKGYINPGMTWGEAWPQIVLAMASGGVAGGPVAAVAHGVHQVAGHNTTETVAPDAVNPAAVPPAPEQPDVPENRPPLPAPGTLLALPPPEAFAPRPEQELRRQPAGQGIAAASDNTVRDETDYVARIALQRTKQAETKELLQTARETITPLGTFELTAIGDDAAGRVRKQRIQSGRPVEGPVTIEEMARAKVPQKHLDTLIAERRPMTLGQALTPLDITRTANAKNIIADDTNFGDFAYRATGQRNPQRMTQAQLHALKTTLEAMPAHEKPVTVPVADQSPFTDEQYGKAVDAVRNKGRYTAGAIKDATGLRNDKDVRAVRDAMVRRGQLVQRGSNDFRLYDVLGEERQATPDDLPPGAFTEHVVRRIPVDKVRIRQDGKSVGTYGSATEARERVREIRAGETKSGAKPSAVAVEPAGDTAWGVLENRYDESGNLLGQAVVDTHRDETAARKAAGELNNPVPTSSGPTANVDDEIDRALPYLKQDEILAADDSYQDDMRQWQKLTDEINAGTGLGDKSKPLISPSEARTRMAQREPIAERIKQTQERAKKQAAQRRLDRAELREKLEARAVAVARGAPAPKRQVIPAALEGRLPEVLKRLNQQARERKLPLLGVRATIKSSIQTPEGDAIEGFYFKKLINLTAENLDASMTTDEVVERLGQVMDHETIHALRAANVLTPDAPGWNAVMRYARRAKRPGSSETYLEWAKRNYTGLPGYDASAIEEEAIAEAFRHWASNRRNVVGQPASVFRQIVEWFRRLLRAIPEDVFRGIETGQMVEDALRPPGSNQPRARAAEAMTEAAQGVIAAQAAQDENAVRVKSREYLRARAQAREDRFGRSGPKTVLGTTPSRAYETGPIMPRDAVSAIADAYRADNGVSGTRLMTYLPEDEAYLKRVADAQANAVHDPAANDVAKAYRALIDETRRMWQALGNVEVSAWTEPGEPYANPAAMFEDLAAGRLKLRLSNDLFGAGADNPGHPLNAASGFKTVEGADLSNNDLLRVVHDVYGHGQSGFGDTPRGAYNAYHEHARLLSPEARRALATETLAQNAWQNYGQHLRRRDGTVPRETDVDWLAPSLREFAEQKAFVLPEALVAADPGWAVAQAADEATPAEVDVLEENPKFSRFDENLPGGRLYGNPNRSPGGALSKPGTPTPAFTSDRPGNRFFGGEMADEQLRMAREGVRGTTMVYLSPEGFLTLAGDTVNPEQEVYDDAIANGYRLSTLPSFVIDGYAGNVRVSGSDGQPGVLALRGVAGSIPVVLYPRKAEGLGLVTALEGADGQRVAWPHEGRAENFPEERARYSLTDSPEFKRWFGDSKVVDTEGKPLVVYHGSNRDFEAFDPKGHPMRLMDANGYFFTSDPRYGYVKHSEQVYPTYLRMENPYYVSRSEEMEGLNAWNNAKEWVDDLKAKGHDGVIWGDPADLRKSPRGAWGDDYPQLFVFEPTQIKSQFNRGTFDPNDPRIRYSLNDPYGTRLPTTPPGPMRNIVQQRTEGAVGTFLKNIGRSKKNLPFTSFSIFRAREVLQDKMLSWKEISEYAAEHGGSIDDLNDVYMLEQLYHGKVQAQIEERQKTLQEPLLAALKAAHDGPRNIQPKEFEDYLYARHAPERNAYLRSRGAPSDNPAGMSDAEASAILDRFALDGKLPELEGLARMADAITADTTRTRVEAGLISEQAAASSPYRYYVPLRGFDEEALDPDETNQTRARSGKGFSVGGREDRTVTGRERKAGDILGHLFLQNTESVIRGQKNEVALAAMRFVQANPDLKIGAILKQAPTRRVVGANGMIHEAGDPTYRQHPDIVTAKWKGKEIIARMEDPRLARAIKSDYVSTSNDLINALIAGAGKLNRFLATVNTSLNPEFLISNLARDLQTAGILSQQYDIPKFGRKVIGDAPKAMGGIRQVLREGRADSPWAKAFEEMREAGGTTEFLGIHDLETYSARVAKIKKSVTRTGLSTTPRKMLEYGRNVLDFINDYNKVAENAFRLSAYVNARQAGVSIPKSAYLARNLTINFNKGGEQKALINSLYLFYNASVQGTFVLMNGLKNKRVQKIVAGVVIAGILQDLINRALSGDDDDNGVPDYDDIPEHILETNFVLMDPFGVLPRGKTGGKAYFAFPMPYGFNAFYNLGRNLSAGFSGSPVRNPGKSLVDSLLTFGDAFNPLGGTQSIWNFIAPTFADPAVDLLTNKDFAGNTIVPDRPTFGVPVPDSQKYWSNTGAIPVWIAERLNALTGGNEVRKGAVDVSPEVLQYGFDYVTGATGKFVQRAVTFGTDTAPKMLQGDFSDVEVGDIPFARRVVGSVTGRNNTERYYKTAEEIMTVAEEIELYQKAGQPEKVREILKAKPVEVSLIPMIMGDGTAQNPGIKRALQELRKQVRDIQASGMSETEKRKQIDQIKAEEDRLMILVNKTYFNKKKPPG